MKADVAGNVTQKSFETFVRKPFNVSAFCSVRNTARFWVCFVRMITKTCWLFRNAEFRRN